MALHENSIEFYILSSIFGGGYPSLGQGGTPALDRGCTPALDWGGPQPWMGVPQPWGYPSWGYPNWRGPQPGGYPPMGPIPSCIVDLTSVLSKLQMSSPPVSYSLYSPQPHGILGNFRLEQVW